MTKMTKLLLLFWSVSIALSAPFAYGLGIEILENTVGETKYMSGGVSIEERDEMEKMADRSYDLKLVFAVTRGNYVADVKVAVSRKGQVLLQAESTGPWFYLDLPVGTYQISATYLGQEKVRPVTVKGNLETILFYWKTQEPVSP